MVAINNDPQITHQSQLGWQTAETGKDNSSPLQDVYKPVNKRYFGALVLVAAIIPLPFLAALVTLIAYLSPSSVPEGALFQWIGSGNLVIILGLVITSGLWLLLAIPCRLFATAAGGRPSDYIKLRAVADVLKKQFEIAKGAQAPRDGTKHTSTVQFDTTIVDIQNNLNIYDNGLMSSGLPWVSYSGYVSMWDLINKVGEAMVGVLPGERVIESANYDLLCLTDSDVPEHKNLIETLNSAIEILSHNTKHADNTATANNGHISLQSEQKARADIRQVKSALHKFTNERWDGLVRARNQLMGTAFLTAFFTYIFVIIAILAPVPRTNIIDAMVFYFLGTIVGLFGRLFDERNADKVIDDYGLSTTRIIVTPLISGLAVLVGILFVTTSAKIETLYTITLQNLVFAAILGFAPNVLINTLLSKSEDIKGQIKGASPSERSKGKTNNRSSEENSDDN